MSSDQTRQDLQRAYDLIKAGKKQEAQSLLMPILKADEENANAWWLLANAVSDPAEIREALEQVLRLRPGDDKAQKMLDDLKRRSPTDEFPMDDDLGGASIGDIISDKPKRGGDMGDVIVTKPKSGANNPLLIVLAVVGVIALIGCFVCVGLPLLGVTIFGGQVVEQLMTAAPEFEEMVLTLTALPPGQFFSPGDLISRGTIEPGQTVQGTVDTSDDDGWTFQGSAGDRVIIELNAVDAELDPQLYLYDAEDSLVARNDDSSSGSLNSRIETTLSSSGTYTIRVSAFGTGGKYELTLRRG